MGRVSELAMAIEALRPFAKGADVADDFDKICVENGMAPIGDQGGPGLGVTFGDLRHARDVVRALARPSQPAPESERDVTSSNGSGKSAPAPICPTGAERSDKAGVATRPLDQEPLYQYEPSTSSPRDEFVALTNALRHVMPIVRGYRPETKEAGEKCQQRTREAEAAVARADAIVNKMFAPHIENDDLLRVVRVAAGWFPEVEDRNSLDSEVFRRYDGAVITYGDIRAAYRACALFRPAQGKQNIKSDGGSMEQPFDPADAAGVNSGTVSDYGQTGRPNREKDGASQTPGSTTSIGPAEPIIAGQASRPSDDVLERGGYRSARDEIIRAAHGVLTELDRSPRGASARVDRLRNAFRLLHSIPTPSALFDAQVCAPAPESPSPVNEEKAVTPADIVRMLTGEVIFNEVDCNPRLSRDATPDDFVRARAILALIEPRSR